MRQTISDVMNTKTLTKNHLDQYPVWKWSEFNDERCPVLNFDPLPDDEPTLFIKARFKTPEGEEFDGYLTGRETFYAFTLFVGEASIQFNLNLPKLITDQWMRLRQIINKPEMSLFPLHYETNVHFKHKQNIQGILTVSN
jgi:hypothetical protein